MRQDHLIQQAQRFGAVERCSLQAFLEGAAGQEAHHDVGTAVDLAVVVHRQEMRMFQARDHVQLTAEAISGLGVISERGCQDLDDDGARDGGLVGLVDGPRSALADLLDDSIVTDRLA